MQIPPFANSIHPLCQRATEVVIVITNKPELDNQAKLHNKVLYANKPYSMSYTRVFHLPKVMSFIER